MDFILVRSSLSIGESDRLWRKTEGFFEFGEVSEFHFVGEVLGVFLHSEN